MAECSLVSEAVVTKCTAGETIGNYSEEVVTKCRDVQTFGNYGLGFVRVRKRKLKGGHADWRDYRESRGLLATASASFDLVRAVRANGKPRHKFVFGLGSVKDKRHHHELPWSAIYGVDERRQYERCLARRSRTICLTNRGLVPFGARTLAHFPRRWWGLASQFGRPGPIVMILDGPPPWPLPGWINARTRPGPAALVPAAPLLPDSTRALPVSVATTTRCP